MSQVLKQLHELQLSLWLIIFLYSLQLSITLTYVCTGLLKYCAKSHSCGKRRCDIAHLVKKKENVTLFRLENTEEELSCFFQ